MPDNELTLIFDNTKANCYRIIVALQLVPMHANTRHRRVEKVLMIFSFPAANNHLLGTFKTTFEVLLRR